MLLAASDVPHFTLLLMLINLLLIGYLDPKEMHQPLQAHLSCFSMASASAVHAGSLISLMRA
jgi:hypothetical protein